MVAFTDFLVGDPLDNYEDSAKYQAKYLPKLEQYRKNLADGILPEYAVQLPASVQELTEGQFNSVKYLKDNRLLTPEEFEITDSSVVQITSTIASGKLSSVQVFKAFAKRATIAHQFTNCALDLFPDEGLQRAQFLDEYYQKNGKTIGPLHGLPVSLKEQMNYKDKITHGGYVSMIDNIPKKHSVTTQILQDLGAVFFVRTNQPQTLMHLDGNNNFIGHSRCPFNLALSSGGSSSGEGAIVAFGGTPLGIGSDIGGSIRGPAAFGGCVGLRPTTNRFSKAGGVSSGAGQESVPAVEGPMARSVDDIDFLMDVYINQGKPWVADCTTLPLAWRKAEKPKPEDLTIAIMYDDGIVKPTPPIARALKTVAQKLQAAGAKVVTFDPIETELARDTVCEMYSCDGNYMQRKMLADSGEPLTKLTKWALNYGKGAKHYNVAENRKLNVIRDQLKQRYTDYLNENKIDFIISPAYSNVAPRPEEIYNWSYTSLYNLIDLPTLVVQTGMFQDTDLDKWDESHASYKHRSALEQLELDNYDPENFKGAPIGLQVSGRRYFDEDVVAFGKTIEDVLEVNLFDLYK
ncbi:amidase [Metschnikowia bicuspidata var. bicuspidata NRRL YB-4993]|uniref:amidase n=1 Tax=Metschnikowia bicuspidata var. bicuspidata NRRL YB-4993 TaxID=869754 RepID=A0A1A0HJX2_9ASCO|nr:amidase [Metschnikowia bicuspidata var. bicuspidata NRRL YB-4993]OBA24320.1 amidase [Metschnikowia bicuspidata var. bicuspidata NRRL YB-4993]